MYPKSIKAVQVKKEMQVIKRLITSADKNLRINTQTELDNLVTAARAFAKRAVILKRPVYAPVYPLAIQTFRSRNTHFDVILVGVDPVNNAKAVASPPSNRGGNDNSSSSSSSGNKEKRSIYNTNIGYNKNSNNRNINQSNPTRSPPTDSNNNNTNKG